MIGRQLKLVNESGKTPQVNAQDVKIMCWVAELIKCLPDKKAFGHAAKYCGHLKHIEDLHWSFNSNVLPDIQDHNTRPLSSTTNNDQNNHMSSPATKSKSPYAGTVKQLYIPINNPNHAHPYNLHPQRSVPSNE